VEIGHDRPIAAVAFVVADLDGVVQRRLGGQQQQRQKQPQRCQQPPIAQPCPQPPRFGPQRLGALIEEDAVRVNASS
jgi:hypothetical protein